MTLGEKIQKLRHERNLTQKELAEKLTVSTADIAVWESDESTPSIADIAKLSSLFGITTDALIVGCEVPDTENLHDPQTEECNKEVLSTEWPAHKKVRKKKRAVLLSLSLIAVAAIAFLAYKLFMPFSENTAAIEKAASSVVKIYCYDHEGNETGTGSGFIAFDDRTVVTNYHVMERAYTYKISTDEDKTYEVENILAYSKEQDIAIIQLKSSTHLKVLNLGDSDKIKKGEPIIAIGSPLGIKNTVSEGVLSGRLMKETMDVLQFTAPISSGSSGGALFDNKGKVIGITYASFVDGQNLNLGIPIKLVKTAYAYSTKKNIKHQISTIYLEAHPYLNYLDDYADAITATFESLKLVPSFYDGKMIKISTYISSINEKFDEYMIANKENISGDNSYDRSLWSGAGETIPYENVGVIATGPNAATSYYDESIAVGDAVTIIGKFDYSKGNYYGSPYELALIHVEIMYKSNF